MRPALVKLLALVCLGLICAAPAFTVAQVKTPTQPEAKPRPKLVPTEEKKANPKKPAEKTSPKISKEEKTTKPFQKPKPTEFIRLRKDEKGNIIALETAIVRYVPQSGEGGLTLDLIGAVHVGDKAYYRMLNKRFEQYDAMLYELVAKKGTKIPKGGRPGGDMLPVQIMKNMLQLDSQLEFIDYNKKNFVHADLSPQEMKEAMKKRGEDGLTLTLGILRDVLKEANKMEQMQRQNAIELPEITLADLLFQRRGANKLKRFLAVQLASPQAMGGLGDTLNTLLIKDRNEAALKIFQTQMANGKRNMALFYGAAHMADFEQRLVSDYGLKRESITWVTAWDME